MPRTGTPHRWVPLFLTLTLLGTLAIVLPLVYNLGQQLRPEQLEAARALWAEHGPADYDLEVAVALGRDTRPQRYLVLVRAGEPVFSAGEGELQALSAPVCALTGPAPRGAL